jgi:Holliday junction resolvasome RuvABC ATP-dependent DNA helicase subunit
MLQHIFNFILGDGKGHGELDITPVKYCEPLSPEEAQKKYSLNKDKESSDPLRMIIEPNTFRAEGINDDGIIIPKKSFEFRPQTWEQFIGQEPAKQRAQIIIAQFERGMRCHIVLQAIRGHGKTSYIELLAKYMKARLIQRIGKQVDEVSLVEIINEINTSENPRIIFFMDEIDSCDKKVIKVLNPIIESFQIAGKKIRPFLFACATINKSILIKNNPDTLDRIQHHINFNRYTADELAIIINQYRSQLYPNEKLKPEDIFTLARNCKYNPRTAINLLEFLVVEPNIKNVFANCKIIKDGLTDVDVHILNILNEAKKPMGSNAIAIRSGMMEREYLTEYEPFLYEFGYLTRSPSRTITEQGKKFLEIIK